MIEVNPSLLVNHMTENVDLYQMKAIHFLYHMVLITQQRNIV